MKFKIGVVATVFVLGCSAFSKAPVSMDDGVVRSIYELESLFVGQQLQLLPIRPSSEEVYVHFHEIVVSVDWKKFPKEFTSKMYAEMDANGYPVYRISIYEDPITRETVFLSSGYEIYRLYAEADYDPYAWEKVMFTLESGHELDRPRQWIHDPAHIAADFALIPEVFHEDYLAMQEEQAAEELALAPMSVMMSLPAVVTSLQMGFKNTTNGAVELEIGWPSSFTKELEMFATTNLIKGGWELVYTKIVTIGSTNLVWIDTATSSLMRRFYALTDANQDTDEDGLSDGREVYVYGSKPDELDSDNDGLDDGVEVGASPSTNPLDNDRQAPVILIVSPVSNIVVVP